MIEHSRFSLVSRETSEAAVVFENDFLQAIELKNRNTSTNIYNQIKGSYTQYSREGELLII